MLLTISTTHQPATDLGYLLHKNPARFHMIEIPAGRAYVYFPVANDERCTAAIQLYVDPVRLIRRDSTARGFGIDQYVNDRPYSLSSFMSVALGVAFGTALGGRCKDRPELAEAKLPLTIELHSVDAADADNMFPRLFEPLGYRLNALIRHPLDRQVSDFGASDSCTVTLSNSIRIQDLLRHLTVLLPVLDDDKHYRSDQDEISKLLRRGEGWLESHPERDLIARRYLRHQHILFRDAIDRLSALDGSALAENPDRQDGDAPRSLHEQRLDAAVAAIVRSGAARVLDLGCGEGRLIERLLRHRQIDYVLGVDANQRALQKAARRLHLDQAGISRRAELAFGVLTYQDVRFRGFDAAALVEVIEHLDEPRLGALEHSVFAGARPRVIVVTTPNREYNEVYEGMRRDTVRHKDHRFEWTRGEFLAWTSHVAMRNGYHFEITGVGDEHSQFGHPSQMAVFTHRGLTSVSGDSP